MKSVREVVRMRTTASTTPRTESEPSAERWGEFGAVLDAHGLKRAIVYPEFHEQCVKKVSAALRASLSQRFIGVGMWRPDTEPLRQIRERIAARPAEWKRAIGTTAFKRHFNLGGESLQRPPRGFDKEHPLIDDIKRKSFIAIRNMPVGDCTKPQFQRTVESSFKQATPYMEFLCSAVGVKL